MKKNLFIISVLLFVLNFSTLETNIVDQNQIDAVCAKCGHEQILHSRTKFIFVSMCPN